MKESAGTLIVPTDEVLTAMLDRANLTYDKVVGSKVQVQSLLALLTSLAPTLNLKVGAAVGFASLCVGVPWQQLQAWALPAPDQRSACTAVGDVAV